MCGGNVGLCLEKSKKNMIFEFKYNPMNKNISPENIFQNISQPEIITEILTLVLLLNTDTKFHVHTTFSIDRCFHILSTSLSVMYCWILC